MEISQEVKEFIMPTAELSAFSHRTDRREIADKILEEGFNYVDSYQKTTDEIIDDIVYLTYWDGLRKHYGGFIIIIQIPKDLIREITMKIDPKYECQQVIGYIHPSDELYDEEYYTIPREYVKGYVERANGNIVANPHFNPEFISPDLEKNLAHFKS